MRYHHYDISHTSCHRSCIAVTDGDLVSNDRITRAVAETTLISMIDLYAVYTTRYVYLTLDRVMLSPTGVTSLAIPPKGLGM